MTTMSLECNSHLALHKFTDESKKGGEMKRKSTKHVCIYEFVCKHFAGFNYSGSECKAMCIHTWLLEKTKKSKPSVYFIAHFKCFSPQACCCRSKQ